MSYRQGKTMKTAGAWCIVFGTVAVSVGVALGVGCFIAGGCLIKGASQE